MTLPKIAHYQILSVIGEGGCGVVYLAEQLQPVRRQVAVKVIKLGMDSRAVLARFDAERQALALMDHPNIARVLDAGLTADGRPFFAMEFVEGVAITTFCQRQKLSLDSRLRLIVTACQAIQHAHQKGVIHRDIKPSNILVASTDSGPLLKVIDFGIAKATGGQRLADQTLYTAFEQFLGTPAYMSPEQAGLANQDIDTRSDVYSLGVLLYELLTGQQPFDAAELRQAGIDGIIRILREKEPVRPSVRLAGMTETEQVNEAASHQTTPAKLVSRLRGDLDWIVMKALDKERSRRYETANGFASDIQRHLKNEPVIARPPDNLYRFQRMVRRNKLTFSAVMAVILALGVGLTISIIFYSREAQALHRAEAEAEKSKRVATFFQDMITRSGGTYPAKTTVLDMLHDVPEIDETFKNEPDIAGALHHLIGFCLSRAAEWEGARKHLEMAVTLQTQGLGEANPDTLLTMRELSSVYASAGNMPAAKDLCLKILTRLENPASKATSNRSVVADDLENRLSVLKFYAMRKLAQIYLEEGNSAEAEKYVTPLLAAIEADQLEGIEAGHAWLLAGNLAVINKHPQIALDICETNLEAFHNLGPVQRAAVQKLRGEAYLALGNYTNAEKYLQLAFKTEQKRFGDDHFIVQKCYRDFVQLYTQWGQLDEAKKYQEKLKPTDTPASKP